MRYFLVFIIFCCEFASAGQRPDWTSKTPVLKSGHIYFIGRASDVRSEDKGISLCEKDAKEQLIRKEFGTEIRIDTTGTETLEEVSLETKIKEASDEIQLKGFARVDVYSEYVGGKLAVWALFSIPQEEIKAEKKRLIEVRRERLAEEKRQAALERKAAAEERRREEEAAETERNGGYPTHDSQGRKIRYISKLEKGLKKSLVVGLFGNPHRVDTMWNVFEYSQTTLCVPNRYPFEEVPSACSIQFDRNNRVITWTNIDPRFTNDLED